MKTKKVVMIAGNSKEKFFQEDHDSEIWGLNGIRPDWIKRFDRMFNLHLRAGLERDWKKGLEKDVEWINDNPDTPFYVLDEWKDAPTALIFPRHEFSYQPRESYHASSLDWMVAYAIHLGFREIELHGIGFVGELGEPLSARSCIEYWCGYAEGLGINVVSSKDVDLFYQYHYVKTNTVYGYDEVDLIEDRVNSDGE